MEKTRSVPQPSGCRGVFNQRDLSAPSLHKKSAPFFRNQIRIKFMKLSPLAVSRRSFLKASGATLALPFLESLAGAVPAKAPVRMVSICNNMGFIPSFFFPEKAGPGYAHSRYTEILKEHEEHFTVFSGLSHPDVGGGHKAERSFLSAAVRPSDTDFKNSISMDQLAANALGTATRFPSLVLMVGKDANNDYLPSITHNGVALPAESSPAAVYRKLFVQGSEAEVKRSLDKLSKGASVLDFVREGARRLERDLPANDKQTLEQYFTAVRDMEKQLEHSKSWEMRPKPTVPLAEPEDVKTNEEVERQTELMLSMARLALETDSTRIITIAVHQGGVTPNIPGVKNLTHALTHHGNDPAKMEELGRIESAHFRCLARFLAALRGVKEGNGTLLSNTMVLHGSHLGNANMHTNSNLPMLLAGGPFRHGQHLAFDVKQNKPMANLFVSMLQGMGLETAKFASSTGTLSGLETV
jgi:hypothetical protein